MHVKDRKIEVNRQRIKWDIENETRLKTAFNNKFLQKHISIQYEIQVGVFSNKIEPLIKKRVLIIFFWKLELNCCYYGTKAKKSIYLILTNYHEVLVKIQHNAVMLFLLSQDQVTCICLCCGFSMCCTSILIITSNSITSHYVAPNTEINRRSCLILTRT